ncbi:hypothetical protein Tco_0760025 [Tanacetum coccineum]
MIKSPECILTKEGIINLFVQGYQEIAEPSSLHFDNTDVAFISTTSHDLPMDQRSSIRTICRNPTMIIETIRQLAEQILKCTMYAITDEILVEPNETLRRAYGLIQHGSKQCSMNIIASLRKAFGNLPMRHKQQHKLVPVYQMDLKMAFLISTKGEQAPRALGFFNDEPSNCPECPKALTKGTMLTQLYSMIKTGMIFY